MVKREGIFEIPFFMVRNLIGVKALLNREERTFIFDTGAQLPVLNTEYMDVKNMPARGDIEPGPGNLGVLRAQDGLITLSMGQITKEYSQIPATNLNYLREEMQTDEEIYGLMGYDFFTGYDLLFDYENKKITFVKNNLTGEFIKDELGRGNLTTIPFNYRLHIPVIEAKIGERSYEFGVDCGAETNLFDRNLFEELREHLDNITEDNLVGVYNAQPVVKRAVLRRLEVSSKIFENMLTVFSELAAFMPGINLNIDGFLGYEFLSKQKTFISYSRREIVLVEG